MCSPANPILLETYKPEYLGPFGTLTRRAQLRRLAENLPSVDRRPSAGDHDSFGACKGEVLGLWV